MSLVAIGGPGGSRTHGVLSEADYESASSTPPKADKIKKIKNNYMIFLYFRFPLFSGDYH
jgi:hypothetical protein